MSKRRKVIQTPIDKTLAIIPPGTYTVKMVGDRKARIVEGPHKGREIYLDLSPFRVAINQERWEADNVRFDFED